MYEKFKKFIFFWFTWQIIIIGVMGWSFDLKQGDKVFQDRTVNCSSLGYVFGISVVDLTLPLIQFSALGPRGCDAK